MSLYFFLISERFINGYNILSKGKNPYNIDSRTGDI